MAPVDKSLLPTDYLCECGGQGMWHVQSYQMKFIECTSCGNKTHTHRDEDLVFGLWRDHKYTRRSNVKKPEFEAKDLPEPVNIPADLLSEDPPKELKDIKSPKTNGDCKYPSAIKILEDAIKAKLDEIQQLAKEIDEIKKL